MDVAKQANQIVKKVLEKLTDEKDIARFKDVPEIFNNASGMINGNAMNEALLKGWMVSQANNAVFLLWRRGILTEDIEKEYRALPSTEEAVKDYDDLQAKDKAIADELEAKRKEYMDGQHVLDIFKAVLNGVPKEKAEAQYEEYRQKLARSMGA